MEVDKIYVPVPTDPSSYGDQCTDDDAELYAEYQADRIRAWLAEKWPEAEIEIAMVPTTGHGFYGRIHVYDNGSPSDNEDAVQEEVSYYIEQNWVQWMAEAAEATAE